MARNWKKQQNKRLGSLGRQGYKTLRSPNVRNLALTAYKGVKYIRSLVNSEVYKYDISNQLTFNTTPGVVHLTGIAQGDTLATRTGNSILCKGVYLRLLFSKHASATFTQIRVVLVRDNQQISDTSPSYTDVFDASSTFGRVNPNTAGRFSILYDKMIVLSSQRDFSQQVIYRKMLKHIKYNGTADTDIQKGGLYLMYLTNEATNVPSLTYTSRVYYHDN